jgi:hypothetical protein
MATCRPCRIPPHVSEQHPTALPIRVAGRKLQHRVHADYRGDYPGQLAAQQSSCLLGQIGYCMERKQVVFAGSDEHVDGVDVCCCLTTHSGSPEALLPLQRSYHGQQQAKRGASLVLNARSCAEWCHCLLHVSPAIGMDTKLLTDVPSYRDIVCRGYFYLERGVLQLDDLYFAWQQATKCFPGTRQPAQTAVQLGLTTAQSLSKPRTVS